MLRSKMHAMREQLNPRNRQFPKNVKKQVLRCCVLDLQLHCIGSGAGYDQGGIIMVVRDPIDSTSQTIYLRSIDLQAHQLPGKRPTISVAPNGQASTTLPGKHPSTRRALTLQNDSIDSMLQTIRSIYDMGPLLDTHDDSQLIQHIVEYLKPKPNTMETQLEIH